MSAFSEIAELYERKHGTEYEQFEPMTGHANEETLLNWIRIDMKLRAMKQFGDIDGFSLFLYRPKYQVLNPGHLCDSI